jgi:hypothetical protein
MSRYQVSFHKTLLSSDGHPRCCPQERVEVAANDLAGALAQALLHLTRLAQIRDIDADRVEIERLPDHAANHAPEPVSATAD